MPFKPATEKKVDAFAYVCKACDFGQLGNYKSCPDWQANFECSDTCVKVFQEYAASKDICYDWNQIPSLKAIREKNNGALHTPTAEPYYPST